MNEDRKMKKIVVVGGGTAGWLSAAYMASKIGTLHGEELAITLIESSDIPTIGVGEATTPSIRATLADIGFNEFDFMRLSDATFKHGILFKNWEHEPDSKSENSYFHPFERPLRAGTDGLEQYWLRGLDPKNRPFQDAISIQNQIAMAGFAPKTTKDRDWDGPIPYAYHLDAGKLAEALKLAAKQRGVEHIVDTINVIATDEMGIKHLELASGSKVDADLYIDCSGFASLLINSVGDDDFEDYSRVLFCDSAVTLQIPNQANSKVPPYTTATAMENGWIWDIGLVNRRGTGYVYSSKYCTAENAEAALKKHLGVSQATQTRHLKFRVGHRHSQWRKNCVAVGLSSGFIEPLESTGIHLVEQALWALASLIPRYFSGIASQTTFNHIMNEHYRHAIHFVKYHYILSNRKDSQFWLDNVNRSSWTSWLVEKSKIWESGYPDIYDLENLHTIFDHASYQYVYFGMHQKPPLSEIGGKREEFAKKIFSRVADGVKNAEKRLIRHDELLGYIHAEKSNHFQFTGNEINNAKINTSIRTIPSNFSNQI